jgi:hypothetical protein
MEIKRDFQAEYDLLIASAGDTQHARRTTEQITALLEDADDNIERDYQSEYGLLVTASVEVTGGGNSRAAVALVDDIGDLLRDASAAGVKIAAATNQAQA